MRYALIWLTLAGAMAVGVGSLNWLTFRRLSTEGIPSQARVVELLPKVHNTVKYAYPVGGKLFQGQTQSWPPNPPLEQLVVGQTLTIYFDPAQPERSVLGDPKEMLTNETIFIAITSVLIPTFIIGAWKFRASRTNRLKRA